MATPLLSPLTPPPLSKHLPITPQITLTPTLLPIPPLKQKPLPPHPPPLKTIILPNHNHNHIHDIPQTLRQP
ncbi:S16 family serine protease, partial [Bacillus altitudinis]|uniref:S16 family serine protease n=1 Tax=Bacillus altitudinis TaxID=293387 RepID=UPI003B51C16F